MKKLPQWMDLSKDAFSPGQIFDLSSYWGVIRTAIFVALLHFFMWHFIGIRQETEQEIKEAVFYRTLISTLAIICYLGLSINALTVYLGPEGAKRYRESRFNQWLESLRPRPRKRSRIEVWLHTTRSGRITYWILRAMTFAGCIWYGYEIGATIEPQFKARGENLPSAYIISGFFSLMLAVKIFYQAASAIIVPIYRRMELKASSRGQWYDRADLKKEDLYGEAESQDDETETGANSKQEDGARNP